MQIEVLLGKPVYLLPLIKRELFATPKNLRYPFRLDWSEKIEVPMGEDGFDVDSFDNLEDLRAWIDENWSWLPDGWWVLVGRGIYSHATPTRRFSLRQLVRQSHRVGRPRRTRRQHRFQGICTLLKVEMDSGECVKIFSKRRMSKFAPYKFHTYPVLQWIAQKNAKKRGDHLILNPYLEEGLT